MNMKYLWRLFCLMKVTDNAHYVALQLDFLTVSWNLNNQSLGEYPRDWPAKGKYPGGLRVDPPRGSAMGTGSLDQPMGKGTGMPILLKCINWKTVWKRKLAFYFQDVSMLNYLPICSTVTDSFLQSEGVFISPLLYSVLSAALSRSVKYS